MQRVMLRWQAGSLSGWGVLGLNLFEHWAAGPDIQPLMGIPLELRAFPGTSPLRYAAMRPAADAANEFIGEDVIQHTPKDETVRIKLGTAFDRSEDVV